MSGRKSLGMALCVGLLTGEPKVTAQETNIGQIAAQSLFGGNQPWLSSNLSRQAPPANAKPPRERFRHPDATRRQIVPFLDGTRVLHHIRFDSDIDRVDQVNRRPQLRFEGDIQPNLVALQNFSDRLQIDKTLENGRARIAYSVVATPRVRLRMFNDRSAPVRTPSYMPKGTGMLMRLRGQKNDSVGLSAGMVTLGHHSNGQDGCLFETDTLQGDDCVGPADLNRINLKDGSFSTNYVRLGARYRRTRLRAELEDANGRTRPDPAGSPDLAGGVASLAPLANVPDNVALPERQVQAGYREWTLGFDVDLHFNTDERIEPFYSSKRFEAMAGGALKFPKVCKGRATGQVSIRYIGEPPIDGNSWVYQADGTCTFNDSAGWGLFVRFYKGQDYYNLGFARSLSRLQFGFHYENDGFLRFVRANPTEVERRAARRPE